MNLVDYSIITFVNHFSRKSSFFDALIDLLVVNNLFKGGVIAMAFWLLWFSKRTLNREKTQQILLATLAGGFAAMFAARVLVHVLPFRVRPLFNPDLHFVAPIGNWHTMASASFGDVNSMPSDTATLVIALSFGLLLASRRVGLWVMAYAIVFVCLPRVYIGVHNPTDLLAGGLLGASCVWLATRPAVLKTVFEPLLTYRSQHAGFFYLSLFLITYQIGTMFEGLRGVATFFLGTH
ncbi:phosphatase PAP2 family protein [Hymenobacter setariae]|uniref:Phosphatase PAP2 family protein n=1 Tax=Hymenobacter setariae TaxID=2594794 RepID=A0A558BUI2_9BACT|nr:phosphatase PAP2 family protein [Hymenobacter setariae]TVT40165.1 phosphatase PAP2 family protein [Hymenobacter setariae]